MTQEQYTLAVKATSHPFKDEEAYIADLLPLFGEDDCDKHRAEISQVWAATHRSMRDIVEAAGCSQRKLAERFFIPYRTMEDWCRGLRISPLYIRLMMQQLLGLLPPLED